MEQENNSSFKNKNNLNVSIASNDINEENSNMTEKLSLPTTRSRRRGNLQKRYKNGSEKITCIQFILIIIIVGIAVISTIICFKYFIFGNDKQSYLIMLWNKIHGPPLKEIIERI